MVLIYEQLLNNAYVQMSKKLFFQIFDQDVLMLHCTFLMNGNNNNLVNPIKCAELIASDFVMERKQNIDLWNFAGPPKENTPSIEKYFKQKKNSVDQFKFVQPKQLSKGWFNC